MAVLVTVLLLTLFPTLPGQTGNNQTVRFLNDYAGSTDTGSSFDPIEMFLGSITADITTGSQTSTITSPTSKLFSSTVKEKGHMITRINIADCYDHVNDHLTLTGSVNAVRELWMDPDQIEQPSISCVLTTYVAEGYYINLTIDQLTENVERNFTLTLNEEGAEDEVSSTVIIDNVILMNRTVSLVSTNAVKFCFVSHAPHKPLVIRMHTVIQKGPYIRRLPFFNVSDTVSYVTSPGLNDKRKYPNNYDGDFFFKLEDGESLLVSFSQIFIHNYYYRHYLGCLLDYILLIEMPENKTKTLCGSPQTDVMAYHSSLRIYFHTNNEISRQGFKLMFAVLPRSQEPERLPGNVFNCSVPHFHRFAPLLNCNMLIECEGGEDEQNCSYHSQSCGNGYIDVETKCYRLVRPHRNVTWLEAQKDCIRHGQQLVTFRTAEEFDRYNQVIFVAKNISHNFIGIQSVSMSQAPSVATLYRDAFQWVNGWTAFLFYGSGRHPHPTCSAYDISEQKFRKIKCDVKERWRNYFCEFHKRVEVMVNLPQNLLPDLEISEWNVSMIQCPLGHVTRDFQACDFQAECFESDSLRLCEAPIVKVPMFLCSQTSAAIHYTFVCDHEQHCPDNSDESFCWHPPCMFNLGFLACRSGQCIRDHQLCDGKVNCYDGSDETCQKPSLGLRHLNLTYPPGSVYLDGVGGYYVKQLMSTRCPPTHFLCPNHYCLPLYLLCNDVVDCPGREDEAWCDSFTCPGLYRCRGSKVCLHADNVCDGVPQCPGQDDELLCDLSCPDQCHCQGLAFVCSTNFSASSYPAIRYLDASDSGMTPDDFTDNQYLIHLRLSNCGIQKITTDITFPNLQELDLSWNKQTHIDINTLHFLNNLKVLILTGNPIVQFIDSDSLAVQITKIVTIELSQTELQVLNVRALKRSPALAVLNISWSRITTISNDGFQFTPKLETFDARGSPLTHFPNDLLTNVQFLKRVYTDNFKLCCKVVLPIEFNLKNCHATQNSLASCEDLLRSTIFRVFLWIFAVLSLFGNLGCFTARMYLSYKRKALGSFGVFVTSLSIADFFMGVYLAIVGSADLIFNGVYVFRDTEWRESTACMIAGFMSFLSSEVSALMICTITLDRFIVLRFPFSRFRFNSMSAMIACGVVWLVGAVLASVPLFPMTSHWEFYSQTGICVPLPLTSADDFLGYDYSFSVMILLNLVLFLFIAVGQAVIYWSVRTNSVRSNIKSKDATIARRLMFIVASDFLCWFPIGLLGVMSATGTSIPGEVNVAMAIFVLPFNSAFNPFLYTFNVLMEKRRRAEEARLLKCLDSRLQAEASQETCMSH